jgi:multisubunit Na+/H+ antiporter MnhB subunit
MKPPQAAERIRRALAQPPALAPLFVIALLIYLGTACLLLPPGALWSPDEGVKVLQIDSMRLEAGRLALDIPYPGKKLDPKLEFALANRGEELLRVAGGRLIFERLPLFPLAVWPFYEWLGICGLYLLPALSGALSGVLALSLLPRRDRRTAMWALIAFGSPVFIYSVLFWEHTLATSLALAGAWLILGSLRDEGDRATRQTIRWILGACLLGGAVYIRLETILFAGALLLSCWLLVKGRRRQALLAGLVLLLILLAYRPAHRALFQGEPLPANARYLNLPLAYLRSNQWKVIPDLLVGPPEEEGIDPGWLGGLWSLAAVAAVFPGFTHAPNRAMRNLQRLGLAVSGGVAAYFLFTATPYRSAHGLLFTTPWALLGFTRAAEVRSQGGQRAKVVLAAAFLGLGGYAIAILGLRASSPQGGLEWGARYALAFYPLLALAAAWDWRDRAKIDRFLIVVLIVLGIGFQARGLLTIRRDKGINAALYQTVADLPEEHVLTDLWWLALNGAKVQNQKAIYSLESPQEAATWITLAPDQGIAGFALVTLDHALPAHISAHLQQPGPGEIDIAILELIQVQDLLIYRLEISPRKE